MGKEKWQMDFKTCCVEINEKKGSRTSWLQRSRD